MNLTNTFGLSPGYVAISSPFALERHGQDGQGIADLPYYSIVQPGGAWIALVGMTVMVPIQGFDVFSPSRLIPSSSLTAYVETPNLPRH